MIFNEVTKQQLKTKADKADLANYLPKSGGRLGAIGFDDTNYLNISIDSAKYYLPFSTIPSAPSIFKGTASGNLPFSGGTLTSSGADTLVINRTTAGKSSWVTFNNNGLFRGRLGVSDDSKARVVLGTGNEEEILHTGNSNAVKIQSTAPTDTSALWVW